MNSGIYMILNVENGHMYVGSTVNFRRRKKHHWDDLKNNKHHSQYLQRAYNKYGEKIFIFVVLERVENKEQLIIREQYYLDFYKPEYNICKIAGSPLGIKHSKEFSQKISLANKGKKLSKEHRKKIALANKKRKYSDETCMKISLANKGRLKGEKNPFYGKKHSEETKTKISINSKKYQQQHRGNKNSTYHIGIVLGYQGKSLSIREWSKEIGISNMTIYRRLKKGLPIEEVLKTK